LFTGGVSHGQEIYVTRLVTSAAAKFHGGVSHGVSDTLGDGRPLRGRGDRRTDGQTDGHRHCVNLHVVGD